MTDLQKVTIMTSNQTKTHLGFQEIILVTRRSKNWSLLPINGILSDHPLEY
jgi:hypothetical protein